MDRSPSAAAFDRWCRAKRGRAAEVARELDVSDTVVSHYRRGVSAPRSEYRIKIEKISLGAVKAIGWEIEDEDAPKDEVT